MSVGLLIITHDGIGSALLETVEHMLGMKPLPVEVLSVISGTPPEELIAVGRGLVEQLDQGEGVLLLTDIFGSTPSNIAAALREEGRVVAVAGLNLPMLIRVLNYPRLSLLELVRKALDGGREGVLLCRDPA